MSTVEIIFIVGALIVFYSYIGYGLLLWLLVKLKKFFPNSNTKAINQSFQPKVTLIVAAFNEADFIKEKIENTLLLDYPGNDLKLIFITDGSSDHTPEIVAKYDRIQLLHSPARKGKVAAMHRAMSFVDTPFVIFSDANTLLNTDSIKNIVRHYQNPKVGGVAGEKKIMVQKDAGTAGKGEGLYWKYESFLKKLDWEFYSVVGAAGELFSVRTALYENPGENALLDDFVISLRICQKGYRVAYEPQAYAMEAPSQSIKEEQKRKVRISAGAFQSMYWLRGLLNIFKYPALSFQYISHRVLRWTICPLLLPVLFFCNVYLSLYQPSLIYKLTMLAQILFYLLAFAGGMLSRKNKPSGILFISYYFFFMNYSLYLGFIKYIKGNQSVLWDKAARKAYSPQK